MARHTLSCCIIAKNEQKKIMACLSNITVLADEIIIVDTGSTDKTVGACNFWIKKKQAQKNVKLIEAGDQFCDEDGDFDFGKAKDFAFKQATMDYVMWLDVSDIVSDQKKFKRAFIDETKKDPHCYFVLPTAMSESYAFGRTRIGKRKYSSFKGKIHETMIIDDPKKKRVFLPYPIKNHKKEGRDLKRNLKMLKKEWKEEQTARICFYIANTYRESKKLEESIKWYRKRVYDIKFKTDRGEECYKSMECMAEIILLIKKSKTISISDLYDVSNEMIQLEPNRVEGHYYLAKYYMATSKWKEAINKLGDYRKCKKPKKYALWLNNKIYNGKAILTAIEKCRTNLKYVDVIQPEQVLDVKPRGNSTYKVGNTQY